MYDPKILTPTFTKRRIVPILQKHHVRHAWMFPTFASEESAKHSRLGFLLEFDSDAVLFDVVDVKRAIEQIVNRYVDVTTTNAVLPQFRDHIHRYKTSLF